MNKNICNSFISFLSIAAFVCIIYLLMVYPSTNSFAIIWLYIAYCAGVIISFFAALYYAWKYEAANEKVENFFGYNFTATLNLIIGISGLLLAENTGLYLILIVLNLIIGFYMFKNIFTKQR